MTEADYADFLVVGGGTCGCVVAARLSEDPSATVMLLESGSGYRSALELPDVLGDPYRLPVGPASEYTWTYPVELTPRRASTIARGRTLGG
ncbi:MAG: mycofactocin system GMC family oxidoreductase MftG, partial [Rhodococcus sp. (in: high G+C Gram-positive bacteria)]